MEYEVYIDDMRLPIPPRKIPVKYPGQNKAVTLISGEEVNLIRPPGLAEISIDAIIPQMGYPAAAWDGSADGAEGLISRLRELKESGDVFEFIVIRGSFDTNMDMTLEDLKVSDDVNEGLDIAVSITMKEARGYGTKVMDFAMAPGQTAPVAEEPEPERKAAPPQAGSYTVQQGDCLWNIAKKMLGDGSRYVEIYRLNKDKVSDPNKIRAGQVLALP